MPTDPERRFTIWSHAPGERHVDLTFPIGRQEARLLQERLRTVAYVQDVQIDRDQWTITVRYRVKQITRSEEEIIATVDGGIAFAIAFVTGATYSHRHDP